MKTFLTAIATVLLGATSTMPLDAQVNIMVQGVNSPSVVGEAVEFDSPGAGQMVTKRVYLTFRPTSGDDLRLEQVRIRGGSGQFTSEVKGIDTFPVAIRNELRIEIYVVYIPSGPGPAYATLEVVTEEGDDFGPKERVYSVGLVGRAPSLGLSYMLPGGGSQPVPLGGIVDFGHRPTGETSELMLTLTNAGSAASDVRNVTVAGSAAFRIAGPSAFPARLEPGRSVSFQLGFAPARGENYRGELTMDFGAGRRRFGLAGTGGELLKYRLISYAADGFPQTVADVAAGAEIEFASGVASVAVVALNSRASSHLVRRIAVTGPFEATDAPDLPATLGSQDSITVQLEPRPSEVGTISGTLMIDDEEFGLSYTLPGLASVSFTREGATLGAEERVPLGLSLASPFLYDISGTLDLAFLGADFDGDPSVQWSTGGRQARFAIPAGETEADFGVSGATAEFRAGAVAGEVVVTASLAADELRLDLTPDPAPELRFGVEVAEDPAFSFTRDGSTLVANEDVSLGARIAAPYPVEVTGTLSLQFLAEDLDAAQAVQWATGGRQVEFSIPAGATEADFGSSGAVAEFRAGTVAGEVVVSASLAAAEWRLELTPDPAPQLRFRVEVPEDPAFSFTRVGGSVGVNEDVSLGARIAAPYPVEVTGMLSLQFLPEDLDVTQAVQWATGGRQVAFTIPVGETEAAFGAEGSEAKFRAAKVAGEVVVTASWAAEEWRLDFTPGPPPEVRFSIQIPDLPAVTYSSSGGAVGAAEQVSVGLSLEQPYSTDIMGVLTLAFETDVFTTDPSVQWATGGRQVPFSIPSGQTAAEFRNQATTNAFQTGTVAGEIVVRARFISVSEGIPQSMEQAQAQAGSIDITPDTLPEVRFQVAKAAPVLQRVVLGNAGQGRFTLQVTGYTSAREVDKLSFSFAGVTGSDLRTPSFEADVSQAFRTYFGGNQSVSFGSQFMASAEFTFDEGEFDDLGTVSVTAANASGESNSVSLALN